MRKELSNFRNDRGKTIEEMANKIGVSKSFYEKIEYGDKNPSYNFIRKFKKAFPYSDIEKLFFSQ